MIPKASTMIPHLVEKLFENQFRCSSLAEFPIGTGMALASRKAQAKKRQSVTDWLQVQHRGRSSYNTVWSFLGPGYGTLILRREASGLIIWEIMEAPQFRASTRIPQILHRDTKSSSWDCQN